MKPALWLLPTLLLVAGCVGGESATDGTPIPTQAEVDATTGGIEVQVTDDEVVPIEGAQVGLVGSDARGTTDRAGRVAFSNLVPQRYVVIVGRLGYFDAQSPAEVRAGEVTKVSVVIDRIPISEPRFNDVYTWKDRLPVADACAERDANNWLEPTRGLTWQTYNFQVNATKPDGTDLLAIRMDIVLKHQPADATIDIDMRLYDDKGNRLGTGGTSAADERIDLQKIMKPGKYLVFVCYWAGVQAEYKLTATMTYEQGDRAGYLRKNPGEIEYDEGP